MAGPDCKGVRCGGCGKPLRECSCLPAVSAYMNNYGPYAVFETEGARVVITHCVICGASILCDPRDEKDYRAVHHQWHVELERSKS